MRSGRTLTKRERNQAVTEALNAARIKIKDATLTAHTDRQLEFITEALVKLLDAQAITVVQMRSDSRSWTDVGTAMSLTKQAAQSRFGKNF